MSEPYSRALPQTLADLGARFVELLGLIVRRAEELGVGIALEGPHVYTMLETVDQIERLRRDTCGGRCFPTSPSPYVNAVVELDEGPRLLTTIVGDGCAIGDRVRVVWKNRPSAPPLPLFNPIDRTT